MQEEKFKERIMSLNKQEKKIQDELRGLYFKNITRVLKVKQKHDIRPLRFI